MDSHEERIRGADAKQLLDHPLLKEALETIESRLVDQLARVDIKPEDIARMQSLLAAKRAFQKYLTQVVTTGTMASLQEQEKRSLADRMLRRA